MAFKIGSSTSRPQKISKCISAFEDDDEGYTAVPRPPGQTAAGQSTAAEPGPSSSATEATKAAAAKWIDKGNAFAEQSDAAAALRCWDQALLIDPEDGRVHEMRAQMLNSEGRTYEAIQAAQQAVALCPGWPEGHITLARVQLNFGEPLLALRSYQAAAKLQPKHPDLAAELPTAQMYAKRHAQQQQQQPGSRAHVVQQRQGADEAEREAAAAAAEWEAQDLQEQQVIAAANAAVGNPDPAATGAAAVKAEEALRAETGASLDS